MLVIAEFVAFVVPGSAPMASDLVGLESLFWISFRHKHTAHE
jgi:hypothetical protein